MSVAELRKAAETLRERATTADADYDPENEERWFTATGNEIGVWGKFARAYENEAPYIATMHPGVGLALADLLETLAYDHEQADVDGRTWDRNCVPLARLINGGAS